MGIERFEDVVAWRKAKEMTIQIYNIFSADLTGFRNLLGLRCRFVCNCLITY